MAERRIALHGEYEAARKLELRALFEQVDGGDPLAIDLSDVTRLDPAALRELSTLRLRRPERIITLLGANPELRRAFQLVSFDRVFEIPEAEASA